eukprot:gnl/Dysnectes_brevis/1779_a2037_2647.p1 GENE.gnl/Dysnectes_brevis/1779_a2037_2647~~gnl/Dysnectes_brevis/1779_a2037_2647.p1  ORF type:complete len:242 (-),score=55.73 gnl/Dysnectes_brevis/1779_a2037_2647:72-797(-)
MIVLHVNHNLLKSHSFEKRFNPDAPIHEIKDEIYSMTGTRPEHQELTLIRSKEDRIPITSGSVTLNDLGARSGMGIYVVDNNPFSIAKEHGFSDLSQVDKYVMTDDDYDKRDDSVRSYLRKKFKSDPEYRKQIISKRREQQRIILKELELASSMKLGDRVKCTHERIGTIRYIGSILSLGLGLWVGVELDEPLGDTDGRYGGTQLFMCENKYGTAQRPSLVEVGDFKEDIFGDLDDSESEL